MEDHVNTTEGVVERSSEHGNKIQNNNENDAGDIVPTFEVDCNNYNINVSESFDPIQLRTHGYQLPNFGNETSNTYFKQEYHMYHKHE